MVSKNKKSKADAVHEKKSANINPFANAKAATSKKLNPFEVHVNKEKFQILGRKCKHDRGLPGISRAKALKKRRETLGQEYLQRYKSNKFVDKRIGRHLTDNELSESVINARFVADKFAQVKQNRKMDRFNLNDEEILTHKGQTLEEIENFRTFSSEDEVDEELDADFTKTVHFGGIDDEKKDRKTAIEEMIVEQMRRKVEITKEKDQVLELTEKLDQDFKELLPLVTKSTTSESKTKPPPDDYNKLVKELIFEPRGGVTDKLLSPEEQAKREHKRLEQLENERLKRMQADGEDETDHVPKHRSADDLDDGYYNLNDLDEDKTLTYDLEGKLGIIFDRTNDEEHNDNNENHTEQEEETDLDSVDDVDNYSDLNVTDTEEDEAPVREQSTKSANNVSKTAKETSVSINSDIPYTIKMPNSYEAFIQHVAKRSPQDQALIIDRLIKNHNPKLDGVNREDVNKLFVYLMQYINELFMDATQDSIELHFHILDKLMPSVYDLVQLNPERMSTAILDVIKEKYAEYRKNPRNFPGLETIIFFKLVSNLYSTSDFRHPVVTPTYIFIQHILSRAHARSRQEITLGLFIVTIALEFGHSSKRFLPAVLNFLLGVIYLSIPKRPIEQLQIVPPFQCTGPMNKLLAIANAPSNKHVPEELLQSKDLVMTTFSVEFKIRALNMSLLLVKDAITTLSENIGSNYLVTPFLALFERLPLSAYPDYVSENLKSVKQLLTQVSNQTLKKLVPPEKKPKALRLLEPRIEAVYDDKRRPKMSKEKEERAKLLHKIKREKKAAIREIRRDTAYLQEKRLQERLQSDKERREKVKRIYQEAAIQQGELNELARTKKRKKF